MSDREFIASGLDARVGAHPRRRDAPGARFHVAGAPREGAVYRGMVRDLRVLVPLAVLRDRGRGSRSPPGRGAASCCRSPNVLIAMLWTFAAMALLGRPLTIMSSMLGPS